MSEYVGVAGTGPSAAFFDLDRTLISGSSAFTLALQARKAGLIPNVEFVRDAVGAVTFKMFGASDDTTDAVRVRVLEAVRGMRQSDLQALNVEVLPRLLATPASRGPSAPRPSPPGRARHLHRVGGAAGDRRAARPLARHDVGDRHPQQGRRRVLHGRTRRTVLLRHRQGRGHGRDRQLERLRTRPVLRLQRLGERSADARSRRPPRGGQPRREARTPCPPQRLADRHLQRSRRSRSFAAPSGRSARSASPAPASPPASRSPAPVPATASGLLRR